MTKINQIEKEVDKIVYRCFSQGQYWGTGDKEGVLNPDYKPVKPIDRGQANKAILHLLQGDRLQRAEQESGEIFKARREEAREVLEELLEYQEGNFIGISFVHKLLKELSEEG